MDQSITQGPSICRGGPKAHWLIAASSQASEAVPRAVSFIMRLPRATELPPTLGNLGPGQALLGAAWEAQALVSGRQALTAGRPWASQRSSLGLFPICKMWVILLGSDEIVIKCFA